MTDIIKFNETHTPKTEIGKMKFELAEALTAISDLQNPYQLTELSKEQRYKLYNKSMRKVCEILDINLDMHELMKTGSEGFSYSDTEDDTQALEKLLSDKQSHDIKTKLFNLFTLASGLSHSDTDFITVDDEGTETPATQQALAKALRTNLVELTEDLGLSVDQVTERYAEQAQKSVKNIIGVLEEIALSPHKDSTSDVDALGDIVYSFVTDLKDILGFEENSESHTENSKNTIKKQLQDIYSLNDSMITGNPNHIPTYDDGTVIKQSDLADMNMSALDLIAEMLGFELEGGATPVKTKDQETYDKLPAEDKLNVDMLNKLHEVQDHILKSGQTAVGANRITTAVTLLEAGLGVIDHEEG
ncbi:hypothetical protein VNN38_01020 [Lactococcus petauri]|uniref:LXG domain-containing protein n=1 Tax=Lactococcus petauri TaxID=1940789 RepID=A0ABZ2SGY3_9LACT